MKKDDHVKQVPLVFVIMSGRKRRDYKAVLEAVLSVLPNQCVRVKTTKTSKNNLQEPAEEAV